MGFIKIDREILKGELNINRFLQTPNNAIVLERFPRRNKPIMESIAHEYNEIGFTGQGGRFRRRTIEEQSHFTRLAASLGLHVLQSTNEGMNYYPFIKNAQTLDNYLPLASPKNTAKVVYESFDDLRRAHDHDIIYGDRWPKNILILPNAQILHIDFDIALSGPCAKEFEVSQLTYYTLCAGKEKVIPQLAEELHLGSNRHDFNLVDKFLQGHARHFANDEKYGGMENETKTLIGLVHKKQHHIL